MVAFNAGGNYTRLNNGIEMPLLGLVCMICITKRQKKRCFALETGYRLIDTAAMYHNEVQIGNAMRQSGVARQGRFFDSQSIILCPKAMTKRYELLTKAYVSFKPIMWICTW
ncbi:MAG: hypothetical protein R2822_13635 [Spirosomataceae bacterium]